MPTKIILSTNVHSFAYDCKNFYVRESHNSLKQNNYDTTNLNGTNKESLKFTNQQFLRNVTINKL